LPATSFFRARVAVISLFSILFIIIIKLFILQRYMFILNFDFLPRIARIFTNQFVLIRALVAISIEIYRIKGLVGFLCPKAILLFLIVFLPRKRHLIITIIRIPKIKVQTIGGEA
jgi:hypothetical protein